MFAKKIPHSQLLFNVACLLHLEQCSSFSVMTLSASIYLFIIQKLKLCSIQLCSLSPHEIPVASFFGLCISSKERNKAGYVIMVEQDISGNKALFSGGNSTWILIENDSFWCMCCCEWNETYWMNTHWIFVDTVATGSILVCLLASDYGVFVEVKYTRW